MLDQTGSSVGSSALCSRRMQTRDQERRRPKGVLRCKGRSGRKKVSCKIDWSKKPHSGPDQVLLVVQLWLSHRWDLTLRPGDRVHYMKAFVSEFFKLTYICSVNNRGVCHVRTRSRGVEDKSSQGRSKEGPSPPHAGEHAKSGGQEGELEHFDLRRGIVSTFWG